MFATRAWQNICDVGRGFTPAVIPPSVLGLPNGESKEKIGSLLAIEGVVQVAQETTNVIVHNADKRYLLYLLTSCECQ
jgi:hypothetical protein